MRVRLTAAAIAIAILALAAYGPALNNPLVYDDWFLLKGNPNFVWARISSLFNRDYFSFFQGQWVSYRPLSTLSYILNNSLWGENYILWRLVYLGGHILNSILVFFLFRFLTSASAASFAWAAFFCLHPVHSEVINQISFNEEIMMTTMLLIATLAFLVWKRKGGVLAGTVIVICYAKALLIKETALLFPMVFLTWIIAERPGPSHRTGNNFRAGKSRLMLSLALTACIYFVIRFVLISNPSDPREFVFQVSEFSGIYQIFLDYFIRLIWPVRLAAIYHFPHPCWWDIKVIGGIIMAAVLLMAVGIGIRRRSPAFAVPAVWFLSGMTPLIYNLAYTDRSIAYDHYVYLPSVAFFWVGLVFTRKVYLHFPPASHVRQALAIVFVTVCLTGSFIIIRQRNEVWSSDLLLWQDAALKYPSSPVAHFNLAHRLEQENRTEEALEEYKLAVACDPEYEFAHLNLGNIYSRKGDFTRAEEHYLAAVKTYPGYADAYYLLGNMYIRTGNISAAEKAYLRAVDAKPDHIKAYYNLGILYRNRGEASMAEEMYREILNLDSGHIEAMYNLGDIYFYSGRYDEAADLYSKVLEKDFKKAQAWNRMGQVLALQGKVSAAASHFRRALEIDPGNERAADSLKKIQQNQVEPTR